MNEYSADYPERARPISRWWLLIFPVTVLLAVALAWGAEVPQNATLLGAQPLPCDGGRYVMYDTDKNPSNGAEFITIEKDGQVLLILQFAPGDNGTFLSAIVQVPGRPEERYDTAQALGTKYSHPCEIVQAAGSRT